MFYPGWLRALANGPVTLGRSRRARAPRGASPLSRSLAIRHVDAGSCNGCESELSLMNSAVYDLTRFGITVTPSPRHADLLLITGVVTAAMVPVIRTAYAAMPEPRRVVAVGACAAGDSPFAGQRGVALSLDGIVPVDVRVPGCPPDPGAILEGILVAMGRSAPEGKP